MKIKRSTVKDFALRCSREMRAAKFSRVSEDFIQSVEEEVDRAIRNVCQSEAPERMPLPLDDVEFMHKDELILAIVPRFNTLVKHVIARKVMRHPSVGMTLQAV